jgi:hypothetical protein
MEEGEAEEDYPFPVLDERAASWESAIWGVSSHNVFLDLNIKEIKAVLLLSEPQSASSEFGT